MTEIENSANGKIIYDGIDTKTLGLYTLRRNIGIIP